MKYTVLDGIGSNAGEYTTLRQARRRARQLAGGRKATPIAPRLRNSVEAWECSETNIGANAEIRKNF